MLDKATITYKTFPYDTPCRFSIIIPTWNNLSMLKLCIHSIRKNSHFKHQIIIHINEGSDGSREWVEKNGLSYSFSTENVGVSLALNSAVELATSDYILYLNDDMYVCPKWDFYLWEEITAQPDNNFFISATAIEPRDVDKKTAIVPYNFGDNPENFKEEELLQQYAGLPMSDWCGASWPPNVVHRSLWNQVNGYSLEFFPGFYSDPDFSMKLWKAGVRRFKGIGKSRVYHFLQISTDKIKSTTKQQGRKQFLKKWGITARVFYRYYLRMGKTAIKMPLTPQKNVIFYLDYLLCYLKKWL